MRNKLLLAVPFIFILSYSCTTTKPVAKKVVNMDNIEVVSSKINKTYRATSPTVWDIQHMDLDLLLDYDSRSANGLAKIKINTTADALAEDAILWLDAKNLEVSTLTLVKNGKEEPVPFTAVEDYLRIDLRKFQAPFTSYSFGKTPVKISDGIAAAASFLLHIRYKAFPYLKQAGGSAAIREDRGLYFVNHDRSIPGKPVQAWTQGETEANSNWMPCIDRPNEKFTMKLSLTVPDSFITLSNGEKTASVKNGLYRTDVWETRLPVQSYAYMFAVGNYTIVQDKSFAGKPINYYVEPAFAPYAKQIFNYTPEMVTFFSEATGVPYPWNKYSQIIARDYVSGAMENTTASLFGDFVQKNARQLQDHSNEGIVAHELFHQWFGDYVTAESWANLSLNESFATYGQYLWNTYKHGKDVADEENVGFVKTYLGAAGKNDAPLDRHYYSKREEVFDRITYQKGAAILRHLNDIIGDDAMRRAMKIYLTNHAFGTAEIANWRMAVEQAAGKDMNWFFKQWYDKAGAPKLQLSYVDVPTEKKYLVIAEQSNNEQLYDLPLKAAVWNDNKLSVLPWHLSKTIDTLVLPYVNNAAPIFIPDYHSTLVGTYKEQKTPLHNFSQFVAADRGMKRYRALEDIDTAPKNDSVNIKMLSLSLDDSFSSVRRKALNIIGSKFLADKYKALWERQVVAMSTYDVHNEVRVAAISTLSNWGAGAHKSLLVDLVQDSSYAVAGKALQAVRKLDSAQALSLARSMVESAPKDNLKNEIWDVIGYTAAAEDIKYYQRELPNYLHRADVTVPISLVDFANNTKDPTAFTMALSYLEQMLKNTESSYSRGSILGYVYDSWFKESAVEKRALSMSNRQQVLAKLQAWKANEKDEKVLAIYEKMLSKKTE